MNYVAQVNNRNDFTINGSIEQVRHEHGYIDIGRGLLEDHLKLIGTESTDNVYESLSTISERTIAAPREISYKAEQCITLTPGFTVDFGADFLAIIDTFPINDLDYRYFLKDHLGNIRTEFKQTQGTPIAITNHNYYSFGMRWDNDGQTSKNNYLYNGKEEQQSFDLGYLHYGARFSDPSIGRFISPDPYMSKRTWINAYNFVQNNPINRVDPDGALDSPIFGTDGKFLGVDSEGFAGDIVIMNRGAYNILSSGGSETIEHGTLMGLTEDRTFAETLDDYVTDGFNIQSKSDKELLSNVFTNLLSAAKDEGLISYDVSNLVFGKIGIDNDTESPNENAATHFDAGGGKDTISVLIKPGKEGENFNLMHVGDAANAIHILGVHEPLHRKYRSRGMKGHHSMYKEIFSNSHYKSSLKNVTPAVRALANKWKKG